MQQTASDQKLTCSDCKGASWLTSMSSAGKPASLDGPATLVWTVTVPAAFLPWTCTQEGVGSPGEVGVQDLPQQTNRNVCSARLLPPW